MPAPISSSVQAARQRLADQLKELREDAGLSGRELARRAGWSAGVAKVSRIEHGHRPISIEDLRRWCEACGISEQRTAELLAELRAVATMWTTYKRLHRAGLRRAQESVRSDFEEVTLLRSYQSRSIPGLLQTEDYTRAALDTVRREENLASGDADLDAAVVERMDRQAVLRRPGKRFVYVVEEDVLWYRPYPRTVHADQLRHLRAVATGSLPSVVFGVIPRTVDRRGNRPREAFIINDEALVTIELVSGYLRITTSDEVAVYVKAWKGLQSLATRGPGAAALIDQALDDLTGSG
ncbi:Scr1 family TA system antitoxin-like transcriptional regulator [Actinomadura rubrisoli]|uniref:XRE family transcriptional regulator n=1 Tax=Actinomadura rubrisoli TaxID=2530368 RepID=A0A4R5BSB4_9ACTN|nr:Scr1 family TA system antitoxin-like transcriptional regulator [Actinomadura rubrisoli]TDD88343.1 XRE family transcriptional regulator [Actinomadura rubrisoli]